METKNRIVVCDPLKPWLGGNILGGDKDTYCPELWDFLIENFKPKSIMDIGCGEGHLMKYFYEKGIDVQGIDGLPANKQNADKDISGAITIHDYTKGFYLSDKKDMVLSCEFVEHVEELFMGNYLISFMNCDTLVFTHAKPEQPGHHHVNCQSDDYWISVMEIFDFKLHELTDNARALGKDTLWDTVLIFQRDER